MTESVGGEGGREEEGIWKRGETWRDVERRGEAWEMELTSIAAWYVSGTDQGKEEDGKRKKQKETVVSPRQDGSDNANDHGEGGRRTKCVSRLLSAYVYGRTRSVKPISFNKRRC